MSTKQSIVVLIIVLLIGGLVGYYIKPTGNTEYWTKPGFKTDTIYKTTYVPDTGGKNTKVIPPKIVYLHNQLLDPENDFTIEVKHDTLYLHDSIRTTKILPCYYNSFITDPRIIAGRFTKNGISIDIWDTTCHVITKVYPTNWEKFDYFWNGSDIKAGSEKLTTIPKIGSFWKQFTTSSNLYVTQEVLTMQTCVAADYSFNYKRVGIYSMGTIGYNKTIEPRVNVGIRIKLK